MITSNAQIRDGHQLSSMNQRESNAPQSPHCKSKPWDNISRQDRGGVEQTNHSDKQDSEAYSKRNNCHGSMDQWFGSHPTGIFSNKKKHQKPWKFQLGSSYWTHQTTEPISSTKGPWHCENSHLDAKPKAPAIVDALVVDEFFRDVFAAFFPTPDTVKRERFFSVLKCGRKWLFTTLFIDFSRSTWCIILQFKAFSEI